jgi:hypothetical protein
MTFGAAVFGRGGGVFESGDFFLSGEGGRGGGGSGDEVAVGLSVTGVDVDVGEGTVGDTVCVVVILSLNVFALSGEDVISVFKLV